VATLAQQAVTLLREAGVKLDPGLDQAEMSAVEQQYGISFGDDHRTLLTLAVPVSKKDVHVSTKWVDWRRGDETEIRWRLAQPLDGAVFDVIHYGANLLDYLNNELGPQGEFIRRAPRHRYPPWSDFEMSPTNEDL